MEYKYLGQNLTSDKLKSLTNAERKVLCAEIRDKIIKTVASNGGHLASNLGTVELTVALLSVFDYEKDKFVFDVGHQSYSYKLLTGRYDRFDTLRTKDGISGFPRISESPYDSFDTGHSSTSVSAAAGIARAGVLNKQNYNTIAVIGDGAMTGGLAYEAINDIGHAKTKMLIILNDNEMSIDKNVGGLSQHLSKIRLSGSYIHAKHSTEQFLNKHLPFFGKPIINFIVNVKDFLRFVIYRKRPTIFDDLGLKYYGPVDGHDTEGLINALNAVKDIDDPVLLHVCTKKGMGYSFAEKNPSNYHGVGPFDVNKGVEMSGKESFTSAFSKLLVEKAKHNDKIVAVCAAMSQGTGLDLFKDEFPNRFFDCGIAEEHAVTMAGGLSVSGLIPVVGIYSSFLQRAYDSIIHDVCFMNNHVIFAVDRAGFVGNDGHTHNGLFDMAYFNTMPNITIMAPCNYEELDFCFEYAINDCEGPVAIRYPRGSAKFNKSIYSNYEMVARPHSIQKYGNDFVLISFGNMCDNALNAVNKLNDNGIKGELIHIAMVKPLPVDDLLVRLGTVKNVFTCEEGVLNGGIGETLQYQLLNKGYSGTVEVFAVEDSIVRAASQNEQFKMTGLDSDSLCNRIMDRLKK
ncbi:MAG: 1-deoxy-D-xylulose-5-phosphate synthase [Clostridia bacterium]|nr:1-deoxy-D-xylulose-5-phosphate synthase [Clostridia bacterium]